MKKLIYFLGIIFLLISLNASGEDKSGIESMRTAVSAYGRDPNEIQVIGTLPITRNDDGVALDATMSTVPGLIKAGVTDFRAYLPVPDGLDPATEYLTDVVKRFNDCI